MGMVTSTPTTSATMPRMLRRTKVSISRNNCHLFPLVMRQLSLIAVHRSGPAIDDEIGRKAQAHGGDDARNQEQDEARGDDERNEDLRTEEAPERLRVPQVGELDAGDIVVGAQDEACGAERDQDSDGNAAQQTDQLSPRQRWQRLPGLDNRVRNQQVWNARKEHAQEQGADENPRALLERFPAEPNAIADR